MTKNLYQHIMRKLLQDPNNETESEPDSTEREGGSSSPASNLTSSELKVKCSTVLKMLVFVQIEILSNYNICINDEGIHSIIFL